jgi:hypothetical protein
MAKQPRSTPKDKIVGLFEAGPQEKRLAQLLDRAVDKAIEKGLKQQAPNQVRQLLGGGSSRRRSISSQLTKALGTALSLRGSSGPKPSVKLKSSSGGRTFHFKFYSMSKQDPQLKPLAGGRGHASSHHAYIERELAVEAIFEPGGHAVERERDGKSHDKKRGNAADRGRERGEHAPDIGNEKDNSARGAQAYIQRLETPTKLKNGEVVLSSWGNISENFHERLEFWDLLSEHERMPNARLQNRIIVELPHESSPEIRRKIIQDFVKPYEQWGLRYHVALHAPGKKNDARNFHAHIVFSERPASRILDPETGKETWDFAIVESYKTSSRHTKISHPYRQNRVRDLQKIHFVEKERKRYATIVNAAMKKHDPTVKFDPRSYRDMGVNAIPLTSIDRILGDRLKARTVAVLDPVWTQRLITAEIACAVEERDKDAVALLKLDRRLTEIQNAYPDIKAVNKILPKQLRLTRIHQFTKSRLNKLLERQLQSQKRSLEDKLVARSARIVCETILEATEPKKFVKLAPNSVRTPKNREAKIDLPDLDSLTLLHEAAREELSQIEAEERRSKARQMSANQTFLQAWTRFARPHTTQAPASPPPASPIRPTGSRPTPGPVVSPSPTADAAGPKLTALQFNVQTTTTPQPEPAQPARAANRAPLQSQFAPIAPEPALPRARLTQPSGRFTPGADTSRTFPHQYRDNARSRRARTAAAVFYRNDRRQNVELLRLIPIRRRLRRGAQKAPALHVA